MMLIWFVLLMSGNLVLVFGLFLTRLNWRSDVEPFHRGSPILEILIHPERFVTGQRLGQIRFVNLRGSVLCCGAVVFSATPWFPNCFR